MYLLVISPRRKEAKQSKQAKKQRSKQLKQASKQTIKASTFYSYLLPYYLLSHVQLQLQLQLYPNDSGLAVHTYAWYVYVHAYVEEGGLFGYVIQKSGLQIYCIR